MYVSAHSAWLGLAGLIAVVLVPSFTTVAVWAGVVLLLLALDILLAGPLRLIQIERDTSATIREGETGRSTLTFTNPSGRAFRGIVRDAWVPSAGASFERHPLDLPAGERRRVRTSLLPLRRGRRGADRITLRAAGPLKLAGRQESRAVPGEVLVLPPFRSRRHLASRLALLREMDGRSSVMTRGQGTEFDSLREYVIGDDVRSIDWRATARSADVVVRTWRPERDRRVVVVIDTGRHSAVRLGEGARLDTQIEATLLLAALAGHAGDRVDVLAVDTEIRARVTGTHGPKLMNALGIALSTVEPTLAETSWSTVSTAITSMLSRRALVVLVTAIEPSSITQGLLDAAAALARTHTVLVASSTDGAVEKLAADVADTDAAHVAAAAERTLLEREAGVARLVQRGIEVVQAPEDSFAPALADAYLALKRAGKL